MPKFYTGSELNVQLEKLIANAEEFLFLVSPYIKIHGRIKEVLDSKTNIEKLRIQVLFGKNETDKSKSLSLEELEYLKKFPNLTIKYQERLHAKYFSNDYQTLFTSMNLYDFSFEKNIEFGVLTDKKSFGQDSLDKDAYKYFDQVFENSELLFNQIAEFKSSLGGLRKTYSGIKVLTDNTDSFYPRSASTNYTPNYRSSTNTYNQTPNYRNSDGYCIRCRDSIGFNPNYPLCSSCYYVWSEFGNRNYQENYCHKTGRNSNGKTSMSNPVLYS